MLTKLKLNKLFIIGSLFLIIGIVKIIIKVNFLNYFSNIEVNNIQSRNSLYNIKNNMILRIPKINLEKDLPDKNSVLNDVDKNIQIIEQSLMPNIENSNLILASHSGNSAVSYFKNLDKLVIGDSVYIEHIDKLYEYKVVKYYTVLKNGLVDIVRNELKTTLTLITCVKNSNRQLVIICELHKTMDL